MSNHHFKCCESGRNFILSLYRMIICLSFSCGLLLGGGRTHASAKQGGSQAKSQNESVQKDSSSVPHPNTTSSNETPKKTSPNASQLTKAKTQKVDSTKKTSPGKTQVTGTKNTPQYWKGVNDKNRADSASIKKLLKVLKTKEKYELAVEGTLNAIRQSAVTGPGSAFLTDDHKKRFITAHSRIKTVVLRHMPWSGVEESFVRQYQNKYTASEVKKLTLFLSTDFGKKFMDVEFAMLTDTSRIISKEVTKLFPSILQIAVQEWAKVKKSVEK